MESRGPGAGPLYVVGVQVRAFARSELRRASAVRRSLIAQTFYPMAQTFGSVTVTHRTGGGWAECSMCGVRIDAASWQGAVHEHTDRDRSLHRAWRDGGNDW
ncbi:hypothetical protein GCM10020216_008640 [Nonomuraea helvata]